MGWVIAVAGIILTLINPQVGLLFFAVGLITAILNGTSSGKSSPAAMADSIGPFGALVMLIVGALLFMMVVAAFVGAVGSL